MNPSFTDLRDLLQGFVHAMDLISLEVQYHHEQVAYLSYRIAKQLDLPDQTVRRIVFGALLHDVGSVLMGSNLSLVELENDPHLLAKNSGAFLQILPQTRKLAPIVRCCQSSYPVSLRLFSAVKEVLYFAQIIHLADKVSLCIQPGITILNQAATIRERIEARKSEFHPDVTNAFLEVARQESFWIDLVLRPNAFLDFLPASNPLSLEETLSMTEIMSLIIDFRSPFTAMHSAGVAASAEELAKITGMSSSEQLMMRIAGNLHDIGKLRIPKEILEKPGKLTDEEFNVMKEHTYYTTMFLKDIKGFEQISQWAGYHHEKLNGKGYPFHLTADQLPLGSRIMACADIFSAVAEERPYRKGMDKDQVIRVLKDNVTQGALSPIIVELLLDHYDAINEKRDAASRIAGRRYFESTSKQDT